MKQITFFSVTLVKIHVENETFRINFKQCVFFVNVRGYEAMNF